MVAHQIPLSMGFFRQEYWSGLPFPSPRHLPNPGIKPRSPTFQENSLLFEPPGKPIGAGGWGGGWQKTKWKWRLVYQHHGRAYTIASCGQSAPWVIPMKRTWHQFSEQWLRELVQHWKSCNFRLCGLCTSSQRQARKSFYQQNFPSQRVGVILLVFTACYLGNHDTWKSWKIPLWLSVS